MMRAKRKGTWMKEARMIEAGMIGVRLKGVKMIGS